MFLNYIFFRAFVVVRFSESFLFLKRAWSVAIAESGAVESTKKRVQ